jgi:hypothetical protein
VVPPFQDDIDIQQHQPIKNNAVLVVGTRMNSKLPQDIARKLEIQGISQ